MTYQHHSPRSKRYGGTSPEPFDLVAISDQDKDGASDYALVSRAIEFLSENWRDQPGLIELSRHLGLGETATQKLFTRWAGLSPKAFLQAVTLDHAKRLLEDNSLPLLEASMELGLSSPSRLHDLFVTHEAMTPGMYKRKGHGLQLDYGFVTCPFGQALVMLTRNDKPSLVGLAFCDVGEEPLALADMQGRWPNADWHDNPVAATKMAKRIFDPRRWSPETPLKVTLIGTDFQIRVWNTLLGIPLGKAMTYSNIAEAIEAPKAVRAVGAAVGRNPISFVVPCHRALGKSGSLTGYHWGLTRKQAMLGWEAGMVSSE